MAATTSAAAATLAAMAAGSSSYSSSGYSTVFGQQMNSGYGSYNSSGYNSGSYSSGSYNSGGYTPALLPFGPCYSAPAYEPAAYMLPTAVYPEPYTSSTTTVTIGDTTSTSAIGTVAGEGGLQFDGCVYGQIPEKPLLGSWCSHFDSLYVNDITDIALF